MGRMTMRRGACGCVMAVLVGLAVSGGSREAEACPPLRWDANIVLPPAELVEVPLNGALLATIDAPNGWEEVVTLATAAGVDVPVEVSLELTSSNEGALLVVRPTGLLEPLTEYVWTVWELQRSMFTGDIADAQAPVPGEPLATLVESGVGDGCSPVVQWSDYDLEVPELREPVATYAVIPAESPTPERPYARVEGALGSSVRVRVYENTQPCFEVRVMDYGGNAATAGTVCVEGPVVEGESSSGGDDSTTGSDGTGGDGTTAAPPIPEEPEPHPTSSTDADTGSDTGPAQDEDGVPESGCGCQASPRSPTGGLLLLVPPLLLVRRRARSRPR